jgi:surface antigen
MIVIVLSMSLLSLPGCSQETWGTLGGAGLGGLAGSQVGGGSGKVWATVGGTLLGAYLGNRAVKYFNEDDAEYATQAERRAYAAPVGQPVEWSNPETGNSGTITPVREGRTANGQYCRDFQQNIYVDGKSEQATGRACQQADGTWKVVS